MIIIFIGLIGLWFAFWEWCQFLGTAGPLGIRE